MKALLTAAVMAAVLSTSACSTFQPAAESAVTSAVEYNRVFARVRDEITVLNILRASERQPLQFSSISSVQGGLKTGTSVKIPFTNIIAGGVNSISPEVTITSRNPVVSMVPLATKEFIRGISRPIEPELIDDLLAQGWKKEVVLPLVVGGVVCAHAPSDHRDEASGFIKLNDGDASDRDTAFRRVLAGSNSFTLSAPPTFATLRMSSKDALTFLKDGVGASHSIASVTPIAGKAGAAEEALVKVVMPGKVQIGGLDFSSVCGSAGTAARQGHADTAATSQQEKHGVILRSVLGMFRYLGHAQAIATRRQLARCDGQIPDEAGMRLFEVKAVCDGATVPSRHMVSTRFDGRTFYIPAAGETEADDLTMDTLSLLSYLVGLQTSEASLRGTSPFVTITQ